VNLIRFDYSDAEDMFDSHSYSKGGVILHMLRDYLGDELFFRGLKLYLTTHAFQSVEVHDLRLAFEKVSGEDLNWFFNQWFLDRGHPELKVSIDYSIPENLLITVEQMQDLTLSPLYKLPFEISWYEGEERKSRRFILEKGYQQFALQNKVSLTQAYFDEGKDLLTKRNGEFSSDHYVRQFQESQLGIARYEALDSLVSRVEEDKLKPLLAEGLKDPFWSIRELTLNILQSNPEWISEGMEESIYTIADKDERNSVRAGAIDVLGSLDADKYYPDLSRYVNDSSFLIVSSALMAMNNVSSERLDPDLFERFESETNYRVLVPVAEYYLNEDVQGKGDWFRSKLSVLSGEGLYYFLGYFSEYFVSNPEEGTDEAKAYLLDQMQNNPQVFVRLGAFQGLLGFADDETLVKQLQEIASKETNSQIKNYFQYFLQSFGDEN
jgi:aminopeptidase N